MTAEKMETDLETLTLRIRAIRDQLQLGKDNSDLESELRTIARNAEGLEDDLREEISYRVAIVMKSVTMIKMARIRTLAVEGNFVDAIPLLFELSPDERLDILCEIRRGLSDEKISAVLQYIATESHRHLKQIFTDNLRLTKISMADHPYAGRFPTAIEFEDDHQMDSLIKDGWIPVGENFPTFGPGDNTPETVQNAWEIQDFLKEGFEATCTAKAYAFENPASKKIEDYHTQIFVRPKAGIEIHPAFRQYYDTVRKLILGEKS